MVSVTTVQIITGRSGLVVARLPAAREIQGLNPFCRHFEVFHENYCDTHLWAQAAHLLQCIGRLSFPPSEVNEHQPYG